MRQRPSSRLLVVDGQDRLLLFRFEHRSGPLAGETFWATPGGGLEPGESYEQAAVRELAEETGLVVADPGPEVARREVVFRLPDGEMAACDERFFLIRVEACDPSREGWTALEREIMTEHRWWTRAELAATTEQVWPVDVADLIP